MTQDESWSRAASFYEREFVDPYRSDVKNPLHAALRGLDHFGCRDQREIGVGGGNGGIELGAIQRGLRLGACGFGDLDIRAA